MKNLIFTILVLVFAAAVSNAQTFPESWLGYYAGEESGMNATETRSYSSWANLELTCAEGGCDAMYTDGENSDTQNKFVMDVKGNATTISFYYSHCMPLEYGSSEPCTDGYKKGDLMFKLTKTKAVKGKSQIITTWAKLNKGDSGKVYFKRVVKQ